MVEDEEKVVQTPLLPSITHDTLIDTSYLHIPSDWSLDWNLDMPLIVKNFIWYFLRESFKLCQMQQQYGK